MGFILRSILIFVSSQSPASGLTTVGPSHRELVPSRAVLAAPDGQLGQDVWRTLHHGLRASAQAR